MGSSLPLATQLKATGPASSPRHSRERTLVICSPTLAPLLLLPQPLPLPPLVEMLRPMLLQRRRPKKRQRRRKKKRRRLTSTWVISSVTEHTSFVFQIILGQTGVQLVERVSTNQPREVPHLMPTSA